MYINVLNVKPSRRSFYVTVVIAAALSFLLILDEEAKSGYSLGIWMLGGTVIYAIVGLFIVFGGEVRDRVFGKTLCPYCADRGWDIKQKLKITKIAHTNIGRCNLCGSRGAVSYIFLFPALMPIFAWVLVLIETDSSAVASCVAYFLAVGYLLIYARFVPVTK